MAAPKFINIPSVVGVGNTDMGDLSLGSVKIDKNRKSLPYVVEWSGATYLVGQGVEDYARPLERMDFQRMGGGPEIRALLYAALGTLLVDLSIPYSVIVGLPVDMMQGTQHKAIRQAIKGWMGGTHAFTLDGKKTQFTIKEVKTLAQPAGSYFAWTFDEKGQWARPSGDLKKTVAICDIGFNTLDVFTTTGGEIALRYTGGDSIGMRRAAELVAGHVKRQYDVVMSLHEIDELIRGKNKVIHIAKGEIDLSTVITQALETVCTEITSFLEQKWGNGAKFSYILFTGGGAAALKGRLLRQFPYGITLDDPVMANAMGLARFGLRAFGENSIGIDPGFGGFKVYLA